MGSQLIVCPTNKSDKALQSEDEKSLWQDRVSLKELLAEEAERERFAEERCSRKLDGCRVQGISGFWVPLLLVLIGDRWGCRCCEFLQKGFCKANAFPVRAPLLCRAPNSCDQGLIRKRRRRPKSKSSKVRTCHRARMFLRRARRQNCSWSYMR